MKRQARPFIVEVKQKRSNQKPGGSIWGDLDLAAIAAEATELPETVEVPNRQLIDSTVAPIDFEDRHKLLAEHEMADPKQAESVQMPTEALEALVMSEAPETKKKASRSKIAKAQPKRGVRAAANPPAAATAESSPSRPTRKTYSAQERIQKLDQIGKSIDRGASVTHATQQAGVSQQTYYQWKKTAVPASDDGDLKNLIALEEENKRLKSLLAERLRKENAELKKKLGLD